MRWWRIRTSDFADDGSVLIEALVGVGILGASVAIAATVHGAAASAAAAAEARVAAVRTAELLLEQRATGLEPDQHAERLATLRATADGDPCTTLGPIGQAVARVDVPVRDGGGTVALVSPLPERRRDLRGQAAPLGVVRMGGLSTGAVAASLVPILPPAVPTPEVRSGTGCLLAPALAPGLAELRLDGVSGPALVDALHRPSDQAPLLLSVSDRSVARRWRLAPAVELTVHVDIGGARAADEINPAGLGWLVRGDDRRVVTPLGFPRPVHPGRSTVLVSACANPEAQASSVSIEVAATPVEVFVPLAVVEVGNVGARITDTLVLTRTAGCRDTSGVRPSLRWRAGLAEGMRVAVPHGTWEAHLESPTGARLTAVVRVATDSDVTRVVLP